MLTVLGGLFESVRRCAVSQVPASVKKANDFYWAQEPQLGDFSSQYMVLGNMADSVVEIYLAPKCDAVNLTVICCGPTMSLKQIWIFLHTGPKVRQFLGCCVYSAHGKVN